MIFPCSITHVLDEEAQDLCKIVTPFGKFKYLCFPMGIKVSQDILQVVMEDVIRGLSDVELYIDDIGIFSNSYDEHMRATEEVLKHLNEYGFTVSLFKFKWDVKETDCIGHWITPTGIKLWKKRSMRFSNCSHLCHWRNCVISSGLPISIVICGLVVLTFCSPYQHTRDVKCLFGRRRCNDRLIRSKQS